MGKKAKTKFYAVRIGRKKGIYLTWDECKEQINDYPGAIYKSFKTREDAVLFCQGIEPDINVEDMTKATSDYNPDQNTFMPDYVYIFCDGSEIKGSGEDRSGFGVCMLNKYPETSFIYGIKIGTETNNRAELKAIIYSLNIIKKNNYGDKYCIVTDSEYSLNCCLKWAAKWEKNGWVRSVKKQTPIENIDLIKEIITLNRELTQKGKKIVFKHVLSHHRKPKNTKSYAYFLWFGNTLVDDAAKNGNSTLSEKLLRLKLEYPTISLHQS